MATGTGLTASTLNLDGTVTETPATLFRRLILFPVAVPLVFFDLLGECQPRALAILAHYFDLFGYFKDLWWIDDTWEREMTAILGALVGTTWESDVERLLVPCII